MEPAPVLLLLGSLWGCSGLPADRLEVTPQKPIVPFGGSTELNCSLACAGGTVQWWGLDTALGNITSFPTHSILHISQATVATEGVKICQGICQGQQYQQTVELKVYALPDTLELEASPHALRPGHPASLHCSAARVHPVTGLALTWYRGHQALQNTDFDATETDEELYDIVSTLEVLDTEVAEGVEFRCEVTLSVGQETFTRVASVVVSADGWRVFTTAVGQLAAVFTSTGSPTTTAALPPGPSVSTRHPTTARQPDAGITPEPAAATNPSSTGSSAPRDSVTGSPTSAAAATPPGPGTTGTGPPVGTVPACSLQIWSLPPTGTRGRALRIECRARCTGNATVRWLRTPVALSQYREEAAGSSSALWLDRAEPWHQGHYQCTVLGRFAQVVSLELTVLDGSFSSSPAIAAGTAASLLGLILTSVVSRRLWKRFRS
ncbi:MADCA protein, partial [Serilophus lunatus]|nr:MADCA protein [Serilophus lunatus]